MKIASKKIRYVFPNNAVILIRRLAEKDLESVLDSSVTFVPSE